MTRTVLVTGSSTGIGNSCVRVFQREGWNVVATLRQPETATELRKLDKVLVAALDVTDRTSIAAAIQAGLDRFGALDMVINNAGFALYGAFEGLDDLDIRQMFDTNLFGVMNVVKGILPHFRARKAGHIVNISSAGGIVSLPAMSIYCSSKFALEGFSEGDLRRARGIGHLSQAHRAGRCAQHAVRSCGSGADGEKERRLRNTSRFCMPWRRTWRSCARRLKRRPMT